MKQHKKIPSTIKEAKKNNQTVALVTGVFDVIHQEHINFLNKASELADLLVIGVESDARVKKLKGDSRPINSQLIRLKNLKKLNITKAIFILPEKFNTFKDHTDLIKKLKPNFLAVSSHTSFQDQKREIMEKAGGKLVIVHQHNPKVSTSKIITN